MIHLASITKKHTNSINGIVTIYLNFDVAWQLHINSRYLTRLSRSLT